MTTIVSLLLFTNVLSAQEPLTVDSISNFYNALFANLQLSYLDRENIDWSDVKENVLKKATTAPTFAESLSYTTQVFDTIGCNHCQLFTQKEYYGSTLNKSLSQKDFSQEFLMKLQEQPTFNVRLVNDNIGYILIPGMLLLDLSRDSLDSVAQRMYDRITGLVETNYIKGWIVDLRFNAGGNVYPMLASLHYLLGDNVVYNEIDASGDIVKINRLESGGFYSGKILEAKASISQEPDLQVPVAIITGKMTGSSGEDIAVAFKNRDSTIFIGENTYGLLTGNDLVELPYEGKMAVTTCYITDSDNVYRRMIIPDIHISKGDNFSEPDRDGNLIKAIDFISER